MGLFGSLVGLAFGGPPKMLPWEEVNVQDAQKTAIAGNEASLPALQNTARQVNDFSQSEIQRMLELAMPGYAKLRDKGTQTVSDLVSGVIPEDVRDAIGRNTAGKSVYGGYGGTGMSRNLTARDLGLTSLDLMTKGLDSATRWIGMSRSLAPTMDITQMFVTPQFQAQFESGERNARLGYQNTRKQFNYATSPKRAVEKDVMNFADTVGTALSVYMGGMGGLGGGLGGLAGMASGGGTSSAMSMISGFGGMFGGSGGGGGSTGDWLGEAMK